MLETPYKNYSFNGLVAGDRLFFTDDYGVAKMPQGYVESLSGPIGPYLVPAVAPGGLELPPVIFEGRAYIADPALAYPVTGSPLGQNHVRLIGPGGREVYFTNQFSMTGRIKTGAIPSSVAVERASRYDAPDDRRLSIFAKGYPTLQTRLPGQPYALRTHPTVDVFLGPPVTGPAGELTVPLDLPAMRMSDNGPFGISYFLETPVTGLFPAAVTARDDSGFVSSVPVSDSVFVTKADYSAANQMLTVAAVTADISAPASFILRGVDGIDGASSLFSSSIDIPNLQAPPATVTVVSAAGGAATVNVTTGVPSLAQNTPPIALDDSALAQGTTPIRINVLQNDRDPDGDRLTIDSVTQPTGGSVAIGELGTSLTFTANPGVRGLQTFQYNVSDRRGGLVPATVTVEVNGLPLAAPDTLIATTGESAVLDVLANDTDPDGDALIVTGVTQPVVGAVQVGTVSIVAGGKQIAYLANAGSTGIHSFTYTISDGRGASATATVQASINTPPLAQPDAVIDVDRQAVLVNVLSNDTDPDGDAIQLASVGTNPRATIEIIGTSIRFTPLADALPVETFTYVILDGRGGRGTGSVTVTQNASPVAVVDSYRLNAGQVLALPVLANDSDANNDAMVIQSVTQPAAGVVAITGGGSGLSFSAPAGSRGQQSFEYTISDGRGGLATAAVTVDINALPSLAADTVVATAGQTVAADVLANDSDADGDGLTVTAVTQPVQGGIQQGTVTIASGGTGISYQPNLGATGTHTFTYTVSDGRGGAATASVQATINTSPVAAADVAFSLDRQSVLINVLGNDTDRDGDPLQLVSIGANPRATIEIVGTSVRFTPAADASAIETFTYVVGDGRGGQSTGTVTVTQNGSPGPVGDGYVANLGQTLNLAVLGNDTDPDGDALTITGVTQPLGGSVTIVTGAKSLSFVFAPTATTGTSFTYTVSDGRGGTSTATVDVAFNRNPVAVADAGSTQVGVDVTIAVLTNDTDADGDPLQVTAVSPAAGASAQITGGGTTVTFTPDPVRIGNQTFTYTISDGRGGLANGTVTISVNHAPVAVNDSASSAVGVPVVVNVLANDSDPNADALTIQNLLQGVDGAATVITAGPDAGKVSYTPSVLGSGQHTFAYTVADGRGGTAVGTVVVAVTAQPAVNNPPVAVNDSATTTFGTAVTIPVLVNDSDADNDPRTIVSVTQPAAGTVTITGGGTLLSYSPVVNSSVAPQVFTYTITDGRGATATATVTVRVADRVVFTQSDYTTSKSQWNLQGTAGPGAVVRFLVGTTQVGSVTADTRGAWKTGPTFAIPASATTVTATSSQLGTGSAIIVRR